MAATRFYDHKNAAEYLGIHHKTLEHRVMKGLIVPMRMVGGNRLYTQEALDELKKKMEAGEQEFTMQEIAEKFGIDYYRVYRAFRVRRKVEPERVIGKMPLYNAEQVKLIAQQEEWSE